MAGEVIAFFFELFFEIFGATAFSKKANRKLRWAIFLIILIGGIIMVMFTVDFAVSYTKSFLKSVKEEKVI